MNKKMNNWKIATIILGVLLVISIFANGFPFTGFFVKESRAQNAVDFINENLLSGGMEAEIVDISEESDLYVVEMNIAGQTFNSYISKDGKLLFPSAIDLTGDVELIDGSQQTPQDVPKTNKPKIELFVMSHCPYGTQAEKGIIPVLELLGNKIDFKLRFVYYAMHGEKEVREQLNQYCIQEEQENKLILYLKCFLKEGNSVACLREAGVDENELGKCTEKVDKEFDVTMNLEDKSKWLSGNFPLFLIDKGLNDKYGIQGSPGLVINGVKVNSARDSQSLLTAICRGFESAPSECGEELSGETPGPGFGYDVTGSASSGSCG